MLVNVDLCCLMLTKIDQCCSEQQNHWKIIDCSLVFKVFDVCGGWKVMKIDRIKEKAAQNPRKSSSEARISCNSGVGDSRNSLGRRCFGASGAPGYHRRDGNSCTFGAPGLP